MQTIQLWQSAKLRPPELPGCFFPLLWVYKKRGKHNILEFTDCYWVSQQSALVQLWEDYFHMMDNRNKPNL